MNIRPKSEGPRSANQGPSEPTHHVNDEKGSTIMTQADDTLECHGHHTLWCTDADEGHDDHSPWCDYQVGGIEVVTEPNWDRAQLWVSTIRAFVHGTFTKARYAELEKHCTGIQLDLLTWDEKAKYPWSSTPINIPSGDARTLAALLVAAADISDGIDRTVRR